MVSSRVWASALACLIGLAIAPAPMAAQDRRPTAAVLPAQGPLSRESLKTITIEFRSRVRAHGYRLVRQQEVREAAARAGVDGPPTVSQLAHIGEDVGARIVFSPLVVGRRGEQLRIELMALRAPDTALGPLGEVLESASGEAIDVDAVESAVARLVERLLEPYPAEPVAQDVDIDDEAHEQPQKMKDYRGKLTDEYDHEGFFFDLGFMLAFCQGNTMCRDVNPGYGARLRLGYRIKARFGVSITGLIDGHNVPVTTDAETIARTDRAFIWTGIYGGVRYYPVNKHWFDPFVGIDLGWTWIIYTELVTGTGDSEMSYMGVEINEFYERRNNLSLNGFTVNPQIGVRFFITRNVSLGIVLNWLVPLWREACTEFTEWAFGEKIGSGDRCVDVEDADRDFLQMEHGEIKDEDELPWFLDLEIDLAVTF